MTLELREAALLARLPPLPTPTTYLEPRDGHPALTAFTDGQMRDYALAALSVHLAAADSEGVSGSDVPARPTSLAGWKLVPIEATAEMKDAMVQAASDPLLFPEWHGAGRPGYCQMHKAYKAMLAASPPLPQELGAVPQWKPMESAPKDGTRILAWWAQWELAAVANWWSPRGMEPHWTMADGLASPAIDPTHWMPLPPAPPVADPRQAGKGETK